MLTNLLNKIKFTKNENSGNSFLQTQKNFYLFEEFKRRLSIEKRRAERLKTPLTIIMSTLEFDNKSNRYLFCGIDGNSLIEVILSTVRETDVVSLHDFKEVLVLLPDTRRKQAQLVITGFINKIKKIPGYREKKEKRHFNNFKIIDAQNLMLDTHSLTRMSHQVSSM